jgi:hypothetical protein
MLIEISSCAERRRRYAMHLRGTHCVRSVGKNQISRVQSRVNSGRAVAKVGADVDEKICDGVESGSVHAMSVERTAVKLFCDVAGAVAAGNGCGAGVDSVKQQHSFMLPEQQGDFVCAPESEVI